jgi:hypothetical protein
LGDETIQFFSREVLRDSVGLEGDLMTELPGLKALVGHHATNVGGRFAATTTESSRAAVKLLPRPPMTAYDRL